MSSVLMLVDTNVLQNKHLIFYLFDYGFSRDVGQVLKNLGFLFGKIKKITCTLDTTEF